MLFIKNWKKYVTVFFERADIFLLVVCLICACISVYAVRHTTASMQAAEVAGISSVKMTAVQVLSIFLGIGAFALFTVIDPELLGRQWRIMLLLIGALLVALMIFGQDDGTGNKSWIRFLGIGIQPSEIIKIIYIVISAYQMTDLKRRSDISAPWSVLQMLSLLGVVFVGLMIVSSDLGNAVILVAIFAVMFFFLGVKLYWFAIGAAGIAAVIPLLWRYVLKDYQKQRLLAPYDESIDPTGWDKRWQTVQSKATLASGRLTGVEEGHTTTIFTGKHTDFIFSSIGEMWGMIGTLIVIVLLTVIIIHCFRCGLHATNTYDMLLCTGIGAAITFQTLINIGMCIGITPVIGIALPFFSYGGSSMVTLFGAMGLISGVKFKLKPQHYTLAYA